MKSFFYEIRHGVGADYFTVERDQNLTFPLHMHRCFEMILLLDGSAKVKVENEVRIIEAGDVIMIKPNFVHDFETLGESRHILCVFAPELIAAISDKLIKYRLKNNVLNVSSTIYREMFEGMNNDAHIGKIKGFLYNVSSLFYDQLDLSQVDRSALGKHLLKDIFRYVEDNIGEACSVRELGNALGYSPSYLSRFFYTNVGMSYSEYVQNIKIGHACHLLRSTKERVTDIALKCGYFSISSFNRNFKNLTGNNPTKYREKQQ